MGNDTFQELFKLGFHLGFVLWLIANLIVARFYWRAWFRAGRPGNPFLLSAIGTSLLALMESGFYTAVLILDPMNLALRRSGGLLLAYSSATNAVLFIIFGLMALHQAEGQVREEA